MCGNGVSDDEDNAVRFNDDRPEEVHAIAAFRDSKQGCRALTEDGCDLGYFGAEECQSILVEIRFDDSASNQAKSALNVDPSPLAVE